MRINNIQPNYNNSFKRAIKIDFIQNPDLYRNNHVIQHGTDAIAAVLNNEPTDVYTKEEKEQLKGFFTNILEDYNEKTPVSFHYIPGTGHVLLSGKDAKEIAKDYRELDKKHYNKKPEKRAQKEIEIKEKIINKIENGHDYTPTTKLSFYASSINSSNKNKFIKIDNFNFYEYQYFYTSLFDGAIDETDGIDINPSETYNAQNISAKYDSLTL